MSVALALQSVMLMQNVSTNLEVIHVNVIKASKARGKCARVQCFCFKNYHILFRALIG